MVKRLLLFTISIFLLVLLAGAIRWLRTPLQEEVRFQSGAITLAGTLYFPHKQGPHPAVIFIHGSGDDSREQYRFYADLLARKGIAVLIYDKRGVGASGGSWKASPFSVLADDALAGIQFLKTQPAIDPKRIGAWGGSEGGVIAPWLAARSTDVAFVVMQAATGVTFAQQGFSKTERQLRALNISEEDVAQGLNVLKLMQQYARTGSGWQAYADARQAASDKAWATVLGDSLPPDNWWWGWYRTKMDFDLLPLLEQVRVPVLAVWGQNDLLVPVAESQAAIERAFMRGGNREVTYRVFAGADHSIQTEQGLQGRNPDPAYLDLLTEWILRQTRLL